LPNGFGMCCVDQHFFKPRRLASSSTYRTKPTSRPSRSGARRGPPQAARCGAFSFPGEARGPLGRRTVLRLLALYGPAKFERVINVDAGPGGAATRARPPPAATPRRRSADVVDDHRRQQISSEGASAAGKRRTQKKGQSRRVSRGATRRHGGTRRLEKDGEGAVVDEGLKGGGSRRIGRARTGRPGALLSCIFEQVPGRGRAARHGGAEQRAQVFC